MTSQSWSRSEKLAVTGIVIGTLATLASALLSRTDAGTPDVKAPFASTAASLPDDLNAEREPTQTRANQKRKKTAEAPETSSQKSQEVTTRDFDGAGTNSVTAAPDGRAVPPSVIVASDASPKSADPQQDSSAKAVTAKEEEASAGTFRGTITICDYGVEPKKRDLRTEYSQSRDPICIQADDGRLLKMPLDRHTLNVPPVYHNGRRYFLGHLEVGDYIEARLLENADREVHLRDVRVIKSVRTH